MNGTIALVALLLLAIVTAWSIWWATRRAFSVRLLKHATVSRQWLIEHQSDE